jgi:hypothetical protein
VDIEPVLVKGARKGSVGALLGGGIAALVLGPGAIWQGITNHVDPSHPVGTMHTNYLPPVGRVIIVIVGVVLSIFAALCLLVAAVQGTSRTKVMFSVGGLRIDDTHIDWHELSAVAVGTGENVSLLMSSSAAGFANRHRALEELSPNWYQVQLGRSAPLAMDLSAAVRKFRPEIFRGIVAKTGQP